eukprot:PITA_16792
MWKTLMNLYENNNDQRKLELKDKLQKIKMEKGEMILKYLTKFTQFRDELGSVGIMIAEDDTVNLALLGLLKSWHSYQDFVNGREKLPDWEQLCFHLKSKNKSSGGAAGEALASQFKLDFSLIACMVSSMMGSVWYLDSGTSFHMTGDKYLFNDWEKKYLQMHIEMGDDGKYSVTGLGTITFQREHGAPFTLKNVMYVLEMKKNLVSISMLEDRGYDVIFSKGKVFL